MVRLVLLVVLLMCSNAVLIKQISDVLNSLVTTNDGLDVSNTTVVGVLKTFMRYSASAYCDESSLKKWDCESCSGHTSGTVVTQVLVDSDSQTYGYIGYNNNLKRIVVSYSGTRNLVNLASDLNILRLTVNLTNNIKNAKIYLHQGFHSSAHSLYEETKKQLLVLRAKFRRYRVSFTGHSLGGAIALINAFKLSQQGFLNLNEIDLFTFGQPRVGNADFAIYINSQIKSYYRVTNYLDPVPALPPQLLGFLHANTEIYINKDQKVVLCQSENDEENAYCSNSDILKDLESHSTYFGESLKC